jgi:hypothetical protein
MPIDPDESLRKYTDYLTTEREALNRLYYGFWIMFLGGFVLSLHVSIGRHFYLACGLLVAFRVLAIGGTAVNFRMQELAISSLSSLNRAIHYQNAAKMELDQNNDQAAKVYINLAGDLQKQMSVADKATNKLELVLQAIGALFLTVAFVGSFLVRVP